MSIVIFRNTKKTRLRRDLNIVRYAHTDLQAGRRIPHSPCVYEFAKRLLHRKKEIPSGISFFLCVNTYFDTISVHPIKIAYSYEKCVQAN